MQNQRGPHSTRHLTNLPQNLVDDTVCKSCQLVCGSVLNGMCYPNDRRLKAERLRLRNCTRFEGFRNDSAAWYAAFIEGRDVMQTARRARPSIGQGFYHDIAARNNVLNDGLGRWFGMRGLFEAQHFVPLIS